MLNHRIRGLLFHYKKLFFCNWLLFFGKSIQNHPDSSGKDGKNLWLLLILFFFLKSVRSLRVRNWAIDWKESYQRTLSSEKWLFITTFKRKWARSLLLHSITSDFDSYRWNLLRDHGNLLQTRARAMSLSVRSTDPNLGKEGGWHAHSTCCLVVPWIFQSVHEKPRSFTADWIYRSTNFKHY